jgi:hypothetical protein
MGRIPNPTPQPPTPQPPTPNPQPLTPQPPTPNPQPLVPNPPTPNPQSPTPTPNPDPGPNQARLPAAGTELLRVQMPFVAFSAAEVASCAQTLPQSHTYDDLLEPSPDLLDLP